MRLQVKKHCSVCRSYRYSVVHHINGDRSDNRKSNLITLCRRCHAYVHGHRRVIPKRTQDHERRRAEDDIMRNMKTDRLLTPREVGKRLAVTPRTVVRWINEGKVEAVKMGRVWRIRESEVERIQFDGV